MRKLFLLGLLLPLAGVCQKIENLEVVTAGNKIIVTYNISGGFTGDTYDILLYASHNNFRSPVQYVSGDVGKSVTEGRRKKIEWDAKTELGNYVGDISFELQASVMPALAFQNKIVSKVKRGKEVELTWRGGVANQDVKIELLKSGTIVEMLGVVSNSGSWSWAIPANQSVGKNFQLRLVSGGESVVTESFSIRHKIPTAMKAAPIALLAVFVLPAASSASDAPRTPTKVTSATLN